MVIVFYCLNKLSEQKMTFKRTFKKDILADFVATS
nr:MAG TPA: hypothetical protein [Inoviridae sp.]